jgi:integrase
MDSKYKAFLQRDKISEKDGKCPLKFQFRNNGKPFKISTGHRVLPDSWHQKGQTVVDIDGQRNGDKITKIIKRKAKLIEEFIEDRMIDGKRITTDHINKYLESVLNADESNNQEISIYELIQELNNRPDVTNRRYNALIRNLKGFEKEKNIRITWDKIDTTFLHEFKSYLYDFSWYTKDDNLRIYEEDSIDGKLKGIKFLIKKAKERGYVVPADLSSIKHKPKGNFKVYLTEDELQKFVNVETNNDSEWIAKTRFLFQCFSALRDSDLSAIGPANFKENILSFQIRKQRKTHSIPLAGKAIEILKRNGFKLPPISQQKENKILKILAKRAGINSPQDKIENRDIKTFEKWEKVSTHCARRTFCEIFQKNNKDMTALSQYLGHSSEQVTRNYIEFKNDQLENSVKDIFGFIK